MKIINNFEIIDQPALVDQSASPAAPAVEVAQNNAIGNTEEINTFTTECKLQILVKSDIKTDKYSN